jgi:hypothetical protein
MIHQMIEIDTYYPPKCHDDDDNDYHVIITWHESNLNDHVNYHVIPDHKSIIKMICEKHQNFTINTIMYNNNKRKYKLGLKSSDLNNLILINETIESHLFNHNLN